MPRLTTRDTILILSQVFVPDPASVGQHMADVAFELAARGYKVRVYCSDSGYDDPTRKYPRHENIKGVDVRRIPHSSFGKKNILLRVLGTASFMIQVFLRTLFMPSLAGILFSTSPPLIGIIATTVRVFRGVPLVYWAMDLNPDQLLALGKIRKGGIVERTLESGNRLLLQNSALIVALDRFMAARLRPRGRLSRKMVVIAPWPHEDVIEPLKHEDNHFRHGNGLDGKFVIMYSGNHSPSNPLKTLLEAAVRLKDDDNLRVLFIGGGIGKKEVEAYIAQHNLRNVISLPYQPLADLRYSLSAADVHVVSLGLDMVGIIHPCKVYGAMAVARPVLFFGPNLSHVSDLLDSHHFGLHVEHGNIEKALDAIAQLRAMPQSQRDQLGQTAQQVLQNSLSQDILCKRFCDGVELAFKRTQ